MVIGKNKLKIVGLISFLGLGLSIHVANNRKKKNALAKVFMRKLTELLEPGTAGLLSEEAFDIYYAERILRNANRSVLVLHAQAAAKYAEEIHSAWAWYGDDENKVYAVFRKLKDKIQVSQVAKAYQDLYQENLIDKLYDKLWESEIQRVLSIVKVLPDYRTN